MLIVHLKCASKWTQYHRNIMHRRIKLKVDNISQMSFVHICISSLVRFEKIWFWRNHDLIKICQEFASKWMIILWLNYGKKIFNFNICFKNIYIASKVALLFFIFHKYLKGNLCKCNKKPKYLVRVTTP